MVRASAWRGRLLPITRASGCRSRPHFLNYFFSSVGVAFARNFGEFEFWFAILKVIAILAFIAIGIALIAGWLPAVASPGLSNLLGPDGFAPRGWAGIGAALLVVVFAFGGTEIVAIAAAETRLVSDG